MKRITFLLFICVIFWGKVVAFKQDSNYKSIHIFVALCDNKYQGIVPVPAKIGNGQDMNNNLYWGCAFGIRTYFKKSKEWIFIGAEKLEAGRLERIIFRHKTQKYYLIADAYDGKFIKQCTIDFLKSCSGQLSETIKIEKKLVGISGNSSLVAYIGHDGLMDFNLNESFESTDKKFRKCIILACISKSFFAPYIEQTNAFPLVWTTGLMCPEAYTIHDAISSFVKNESDESIRLKAAVAYSKYQKCSLKSAKNLLVQGF